MFLRLILVERPPTSPSLMSVGLDFPKVLHNPHAEGNLARRRAGIYTRVRKLELGDHASNARSS
jgi:hypothetical protein